MSKQSRTTIKSSLAQGRGLKLYYGIDAPEYIPSSLAQGRGLKHDDTGLIVIQEGSPLAQGRGLKLTEINEQIDSYRSPLAQGRGLKRISHVDIAAQVSRPYAGAWIEHITNRAMSTY